jgi:hypothetical protein
MQHLTFVLFYYGPNTTDCWKSYLYYLFECGSGESQGKVMSVRDKSSTLAVAPKGGKCCVTVW